MYGVLFLGNRFIVLFFSHLIFLFFRDFLGLTPFIVVIKYID